MTANDFKPPEPFFDILKASAIGQATVEGAGSAAPSVAINFIKAI